MNLPPRRQLLVFSAALAIFAALPNRGAAVEKGLSGTGWRLQSAAKINETGAAISSPGYPAQGWYAVTVPCTVLAGLVEAGEYPGLFEGATLEKVSPDRFAGAWWYRKEFVLSQAPAGRRVWLRFKGINYRANVWLNGQKIAAANSTEGAYRDFEFEITPAIDPAGANTVAVEVFPPDPKKDLAITFVDWAPAPPDRNMGLWQDVDLLVSGPVALRDPFVRTDLDLPSLATCRLAVAAEVVNPTARPVSGTLQGQIEGVRFSQDVSLGAGETRRVTFSPEAFPGLVLKRPRVWWPRQLGRPEMYTLDLAFTIGGVTSDRLTTQFGVRRVGSRLFHGNRLFSVNGVDLLILGGGYAPDLLQRRKMPGRPDWQGDQLRYVQDMHLNTVRLEGKLEDDAFYDLCDRQGILVMAGWCCCSPWERWKAWQPEQRAVADASLRYQIRRARTHPSMLAWLNGSDHHPPADVEKGYLAIERELGWPCPILSSASAAQSEITGPTGVKMAGPYKWEPPIFWTTDKKTGGAWGFNTEVGPGAVPPPLESLEKMLPADHRWPIDEVWDAHCGGGTFKTMDDFTRALDRRFGPATGISDFAWKAQAQAYETIRAMFEAFRRNKFEATGEIQWMLNNAWPSMIWHLYDYYLRPGSAYFATKLACEPVHLLFSYDDRSVVVVNDTLRSRPGLAAEAEIYDLGGRRRYRRSVPCAAPENSSSSLFTLPVPPEISPAYFIRLTLRDSGGAVMSVNSYWLSIRPDVLGENGGKQSWNVTPTAAYADYTALQELPAVNLAVGELAVESAGADQIARVTVANPSATPAVLVRLKLNRGRGGEEVLPVRWEDNYFLLLPGESRRLSARYCSRDLGGAEPVVSADCFNNRTR